MKGVYGKFYKASRNEAAQVFFITALCVTVYSLWGAYLLANQEAPSAQSVSVEN